MQPIGTHDPLDYMNVVLDLIENEAYFASKITNWSAIRQQARIMGGNAKTTQETYPAIEMVLERMGHQHSYLIPAETRQWNPAQLSHVTYGFSVLRNERRVIQVLPGSPADNADISVGDTIMALDDQMLKPSDTLPDFDQMQRTIKITLKKHTNEELLYALITPRTMVRDALPHGHRIDDWGYLELPGLHDTPTHDMYIRMARDTIHTVSEAKRVKGWVIDVRRNQGGNIWPMLAAIGTILGTGDWGKFIRRDKQEEVWHYENGGTRLGDVVMASLPLEMDEPDYSTVPVALLQSPLTSDAGEILLIAFKGREKARTFGKPSKGIPTLNTGFPLSDGARLILTTAACADRNGNVYQDSLQVHQDIATDWAHFGSAADPVLQAALNWLNTQNEADD
ncbi:MAG: S41 family peptidase [Anaerolineae bacterium]|nr:S41 family peptidase [Anaerolineae bacterium]MDQ7034201.1 S41 family peptidase [Anaerolineae bacterium]